MGELFGTLRWEKRYHGMIFQKTVNMPREFFLALGLAMMYKSFFGLAIKYKLPWLLLYPTCLISSGTTKTRIQLQFQFVLLLLHTHRLGGFVDGVLVEGFKNVEQRSGRMVKA